MTSRPSWTDYFLLICDSVSFRADCTRRKVGAIVVDATTKHIISTGYNGAPPGEPGCLSAGACPRGKHYKALNAEFYRPGHGEICGTCKTPWPCVMAVKPDSSYDTGPGACIALHAETNALLRAGQDARGNWLFCTDKPCDGCWKLIKGAGIHMVAWHGGDWHTGDEEEGGSSWRGKIRDYLR